MQNQEDIYIYLLSDTGVLLMVKKELVMDYIIQLIDMQKLIINKSKIMIKIKKESSCLKYWDVNNLYGWAILNNLSVYGLKNVEDLSEFNEDSKKGYSERTNKE